MLKSHKLLVLFCFLSVSSLYGNNASQNAPQEAYESSPKLFQKEEPEDNHDLKKGFYIGPTTSFGRSFSTGSESSATAYSYGLQTNYTKKLGPWTLFEVSGELFQAHLGHADADIDVKYGLKIKVGYGYSISPGLYGVWRLGAFLAGADYKDSFWKSNDTVLGNGFLGEFNLRYAASSMVSLVGGVEVGFHSYNVKSVSNKMTGLKDDIRKNVGLLTVQAKVGLDLQIF